MTSTNAFYNAGTVPGVFYKVCNWEFRPFMVNNLLAPPIWEGTGWAYPATPGSDQLNLTMGDARELLGLSNVFKNVRCKQVRCRIEWMGTRGRFADAGSQTNYPLFEQPVATLYHYNSQLMRDTDLRTTGDSGQVQANILGMNAKPIQYLPDQNDIGGSRMARPYAQLFDVKGIKRLTFTKNKPVQTLTWKPWSFLGKQVASIQAIKLGLAGSAFEQGVTPPYEIQNSMGSMWFADDQSRLTQYSDTDNMISDNMYKFTFSFDYELSGRL